MKTSSLLIALALWSGRALAVALFLFWGAFFLNHLEWFVHPAVGLPPPRVWILQLGHLVMLIGLLVLVRWELVGSALTIVAALVFFASVAGSRFPLFFLVTILPAALVLLGRLLQSQAAPPPDVSGPP